MKKLSGGSTLLHNILYAWIFSVLNVLNFFSFHDYATMMMVLPFYGDEIKRSLHKHQ